MKHVLLALLAFTLVCPLPAAPRFILSCSVSNDLYQILRRSNVACMRTDSGFAAMQEAQDGDAVLLLADEYPAKRVSFDSAWRDWADAKQLRLYIEYPESVASLCDTDTPSRTASWERGVVSADVFGAALPPLSILGLHQCQFVAVTAGDPWLVIARVAGFDRAVYGIPTNAVPILFELPDRRTIVATTKLSSFVSARYAPIRDWLLIWQTIVARLSPEATPVLRAFPVVHTKYGPSEKLPRNVERRAFDAAADWLLNSQLLVSPERTNHIYAALARNEEIAPLPPRQASRGDGSLGILEGYSSGILPSGDQMQRLPLRADCQAETAAVLAFSNNDRKRSQAVAANLLDYVYFTSGMCKGPRADERHGAFGLIGWGDISSAWQVANYGDDNARTLLGTILVGARLKRPTWNHAIARGLLANFRTTGKLGFRGDRIDNPALARGWKQFYDAAPLNYAPHFESGLWACYLWAFRTTGYQPFLERTTNGIGMTMDVYPKGWRFQDNMERARMLLCLAWLVRVQDTPRHREWLELVARDLLKRQQDSGAIHEWLGGTGGGHYQIPQSNEAYGTAETPLIQQNGDPASDQLYATGFALFGLHEAAAATGDLALKRAADKLVEFLCRIQIRSEKKPYLDGWWFRAFDDRRWEYWASSADMGWGAWSLEAGWGQAWTAITLALRDRKTTFWDMTRTVKIGPEFEHWKTRMLN